MAVMADLSRVNTLEWGISGYGHTIDIMAAQPVFKERKMRFPVEFVSSDTFAVACRSKACWSDVTQTAVAGRMTRRRFHPYILNWEFGTNPGGCGFGREPLSHGRPPSITSDRTPHVHAGNVCPSGSHEMRDGFWRPGEG